MVGSFGEIVFQVSDQEILTLKDLTKEVAIRTSKFDRLGQKSLTQYEAPELQKIGFSVQLLPEFSNDIDNTIKQFEDICEKGQDNYLILGGELIGSDRWVILSLSEAHKILSNNGKTLSAELSVQLEEYISE